MNSVAKTPVAPRPGSRRGFTLIELLTVMTILIIAGAIAVPSLIDAFQTNSLTQAANVVSAYIAEGHNLALKTHQQVAVVFYEETTAGMSGSGLPSTTPTHGGETAVALAIAPTGQPENGTSSQPLVFEPYLTQPVDYLPKGVYLGTLNDQTSTLNIAGAQAGTTTPTGPRCIVFDASGHMVIRSYIAAMANPDGTADYMDWDFASGNDNTSSPGVVVTIPSTNSTAPSASNTEIMVVNSYTGNLIR
ncbi:MAG: pilus assembly FimT family protein [Phycisphaerae bacterium]